MNRKTRSFTYALILILLPALALAQRKVEAEKVQATQTFTIGKGATSHSFTGATDTIDASSTHQQIPTAKSVWDLLGSLGSGSGGHVIMEGNTARAQKDSLEFQSNSTIVFGATNTSTRTVIDATLETGSVGTAEIATGAVGNSDLAANAVDSTKICAGCVSITDIGQHGATSGQVLKWNGTIWAPGSDNTSSGAVGHVIANSGTGVTQRDTLDFVDTGDIDYTVTSTPTKTTVAGAINAGAVTTSKIAANAVTATEIASNAVTSGKIATGAVTTTGILDGTIATADIAAAQITGAKMAQDGATSSQVWKWGGSAWAPATMAASEISGFNEAVDDRVDALISDGYGIVTSYDDSGNSLTVRADTASPSGLATRAYADTRQQRAWSTNLSSPNYAPSLTDSIAHNGPVRIKTSYPTPRNPTGTATIPPSEISLAIEHTHSSGSTSPAIYIEAVGDTSINDAFIPFMWNLDSSASATGCLPFTIFMGKIRNASAVGHNYIGGIGFNLSQAGGPLIQGQPYAGDIWEENFAANDGVNGDMERWLKFGGSNGTTEYRPIYMTASRLDCSGSVFATAGNIMYFDPGPPLYGTGVHYGQWGANSLVVNSVGTNQNFEFRISGTGTGSTTFNMRDPNSGSTVPALYWENGRSALQLSPTKPVLFRGNIFAFDNFFGGPTVIGNGYPDIDNGSDTLNFGNDPKLTGGTYDNYGNYRFFLGSGDGFWIGEYGLTKSEFFGQGTSGGDYFLSKGYSVSPSNSPSLGIDAGTNNVGIKKPLNWINSTAALQVWGKMQVASVSGTTVKIAGWASDSTLTDVYLSGLSLSGDTLYATGGGGGVTDHGGLTGLTDDDHTQYLLLAGRSGGQVATGGTGSGEDLTLRSTTNATKGNIFLADQGGDVTVGGGATASKIEMLEPSGSGTNKTTFAAQAQSADINYTLPASAPSVDGQALTGATGGSLSWATITQASGTETLQTSTFTATQGIINLVDCSSGTVSVTPPSSPAIGYRFAVSDAKASSSTNNITINFSGSTQKLYGSVQNYILNINGAYAEFTYVGSTTGWIATK